MLIFRGILSKKLVYKNIIQYFGKKLLKLQKLKSYFTNFEVFLFWKLFYINQISMVKIYWRWGND
ncbi:hypothetical protein SCLARK_00753 [Spiroplasma clarkii]|nr:hypothetical protein SCLARK_00753 [Spiroplasma clarkii]